LVSAGLPNKEVGRQLNLTAGTIKVHLHNIFSKLAIKNRTALTSLAVSDQYSSRRGDRQMSSDRHTRRSSFAQSDKEAERN